MKASAEGRRQPGLAVLMTAGLVLQLIAGTGQAASGAAEFSYDRDEVSGPKPWTSEDFRNNPDNFQFAILGDRGGGASPLGTYERAIDQLNWMQPEFVMSVGDFVEGYTSEQEEMDEQWEEFEGIVAKLQMPFFYVRGNHDINMPLTLLGVPEETVLEDYLRSNDYILPVYQEVIDGFVAAGGDAEIPKAILGVKEEYLNAAFDEMKSKFGTIEKYFSEGLGIDAAQQEALRDLYLGQ